MVNVFAGASVHPVSNAYVSFVAGSSFVGGQALLGLLFFFQSEGDRQNFLHYCFETRSESKAKLYIDKFRFGSAAALMCTCRQQRVGACGGAKHKQWVVNHQLTSALICRRRE